MNRHIILFSVLFFILFSCKHNKDEDTTIKEPANLIPTEKMIDLITDVHIAEALIVQHQSHGQNVTYYSALYFKTILKKYNISKKDFYENMEYYAYDTKKLEGIYTEVITNLTKKQTEISLK
jgi:hypothetical protein